MPLHSQFAVVADRSRWRAAHGETAGPIVHDRIVPALASLSLADVTHNSAVKAYAAPAIYTASPVDIYPLLDELDVHFRDIACQNIVSFLFRYELPNDPEEYTPGSGYEINYERLRKICDIVTRMTADWPIYDSVQKLVGCLVSRKNDTRLKAGQKEELFRRLIDIVERQLPAPGHIVHDGYKIIAKAQLARYRQSPNPQELVEAARHIPNTADRSLVLFETALSLPKSERVTQEQVIKDAAALARCIPSSIDRFERFIGFAYSAKTINERLTREMLLDAVETLRASESDSGRRIRRIIDLAYKVNKDFANELADKLDDDQAKRYAKEQINVLNLKQHVIDEKAMTEQVESAPRGDYKRLDGCYLRH